MSICLGFLTVMGLTKSLSQDFVKDLEKISNPNLTYDIQSDSIHQILSRCASYSSEQMRALDSHIKMYIKNLSSPSDQAHILYSYASCYASRKKHTKSILFYQDALSIYENIGDTLQSAYTHLHISRVHRARHEEDAALNCLNTSSNLLSAYSQNQGYQYDQFLAQIHNEIGTIYVIRKDWDRAEEHFTLSLDLYNSLSCGQNDRIRRNSVAVTVNLINLYEETQKWEEMETYLSQIIEQSKQVKNQEMHAQVLHAYGKWYQYQENYKKAKVCFQQAYNIYQKAHAKEAMTEAIYKLGDVSLAMRSLTKAEGYYRKGLHLALKQRNETLVADGYRKIASLSEMKEDFPVALAYYQKYRDHKSSQFDESNAPFYTELDMLTYEREEALDQARMLVLKEDIQKQENQKLKQIASIVIVLISIILTLLIRSYYVERKVNLLLEQKNHELQYALKNLNAAVVQLKKSEEKEKKAHHTQAKLFSVIGHDLKGPLSSIVGFTGILQSQVHTFSKERIQTAAAELHQSSKKLYCLLNNLLQWTKTQSHEITCNPQQLDLATTINENLQLLKGQAEKKQIHLVADCSPNLSLHTDKNMLDTVLRNLTSNAIKFTPVQGTVKVSAALQGEYVQVQVQDNGMGMSNEVRNRLFDPHNHPTTTGTNNETGTGLGLLICKEFIHKMGGKIQIDSQEGAGTRISFKLVA